MRTVVTGGAGFIGAYLVRRLLDQGREVVVLDDFSRGRRERLDELGVSRASEILPVDLSDPYATRKALAKADTVFHLAAHVGNVETLHGSTSAELFALQTNLVIDANVLQACLKLDVGRIVYASSVSVYPVGPQQGPLAVFREEDIIPIEPEGGYGWAKLLGELQLQWTQGVRVGIARIFSAYGEGEVPDENAHAVPALMRKAIMWPKERFVVWGNGEQTRDYVHVSDAVELLIRLEEYAASPPLIVNVGSGRAVSIGSLVEKIVQISGRHLQPIYDDKKPVGPRSRAADISRARAVLGWEPQVDLDEGLVRTFAWVTSWIESH